MTHGHPGSPGPPPGEPLSLESRPGQALAVRFTAMASPCELLLHTKNRADALELGAIAAAEVWRIESKFSRYRDDSVVAWIHQHRGSTLRVDEETASLLDFAKQCFELSDGRFDITSGVLRGLWKFDGSDRIPDAAAVKQMLLLIGFNKIQWHNPSLCLPVNMELDFGGIGKEYAVDRTYDLLVPQCPYPFLVNLGGDLRANRPPPHGPWKLGVEHPDMQGSAAMMLDLEYGALATSGDAHRYLLKDGIRYCHILDPKTGWPPAGAPRSITVAASSCTEAGLISTLAMLHGANARTFLEEQSVSYWIID